ncbi:efflux RND transporter periplasmic adaptor subunit [Pseudaminobacter sp. 19-2017]|uniref:Efflux RND transporter periplasmic adaptor subunit n=1 Tax=Pseudaminobacter soli (ex Zhang et al. 2022) TaxID=2831468 RepID=A0A942E0R0_9HYPH|nr:efflux RND transporter periplasmic adaptor subunit [Pseudaminobacter soli]MBS3651714.1 efflux RND transporter periplasmic adaptor subunit [Pseudaminobacter soli]
MKALSYPARLASTLTLLSLVVACSESQGNTPPPPAPPPPLVSVVEVKPEQLAVTNELPGRVAPTRIAEVRPRISGIVVERVFEQGSFVEQGDVLYRIDPEPFRVQVDAAQATLMRAQATHLLARQQADRQNELRERNITSVQQQDSAVAALAQADADVAAAQSGLAAAKLNLAYAEVKAPIAGRIGRAMITEGALVSSAESLATVQQLDPVYIDFTQSSMELLRLRQALEAGVLDSPAPGEASVRIHMDDGSEYPQTGRLLFSEATVDPTTGQVTMRAEVPNPKGDLLPGLYVRVLIEQGIEKSAIAIPQQAVQRDAGGASQVYLVNAENVAELRKVRVGRTLADRVVIEDGLNGGEKVVVEGFQKLRPGAQVNPEVWSAKDSTTAETPRQDKQG